MTNEEKIEAIQYVINHPHTEEVYYRLLEDMGGLKQNYWDYMTTEPIDCDIELERIAKADFDLCTALLTMLLREDHFCNGAFMSRQKSGQVDAILNRMVEELMMGTTTNKILSVKDEISYHSIKDICNGCFGKNYKDYQRGSYMINDYYMAWFPQIAYVENGILKAGSKTKGWINEISEDGEFIKEYNENEPRNEDSPKLKAHRVVFAKHKYGEYKFLGIYKTVSFFDADVLYAKRLYQRIATEADLSILGKESYETNEEQFIQDAYEIKNITNTEKEAIVKTRIGQSEFRKKLMLKHNAKCMICSLKYEGLLIASHIKEWSVADSKERLDVENGLLLCTVHDAVFDKHLISFSDDGEIQVSPKLSEKDRALLNLHSGQKIQLTEGMKKYMKYHRDKFDELNVSK